MPAMFLPPKTSRAWPAPTKDKSEAEAYITDVYPGIYIDCSDRFAVEFGSHIQLAENCYLNCVPVQKCKFLPLKCNGLVWRNLAY